MRPALADPVPTHRQPELGPRVAAVVDEGEEVAVRRGSRRDLERRRRRRGGAASRCRSRTAPSTAARVAELDQAAFVSRTSAAPAVAPAPSASASRTPARGRIERQRVLDVGQEQLLVLLLVLQAEADESLDLGVAGARCQQRLHSLVDVGAVAQHVGQRRPRDQAALGTRMLRADALVVAVEEHAKGRIEGREARARSARAGRSRRTR